MLVNCFLYAVCYILTNIFELNLKKLILYLITLFPWSMLRAYLLDFWVFFPLNAYVKDGVLIFIMLIAFIHQIFYLLLAQVIVCLYDSQFKLSQFTSIFL